MLNDSFKIRYKSLPFAISEQNDFSPTKLHNHNEFEILLINEGSCIIRIANREYRAKGGDMIFINPMEVHEVIVNRDSSYSHQCVCFDISVIMNNQFSENLANECTSILHIVGGDTCHGQYLKGLFEKVIDIFKSDGKTMAMDISAYITLMFSYLIKNSLFDIKRAEPKENRFCREIIEYIKQNYGEKITSKQAAEECFFNHSYFCRKFRESFGMSFSSYLNIWRISAARAMLEENSESVAVIAEKCGFNTPAYFSGCFKKLVGVLPCEYKKGKRS